MRVNSPIPLPITTVTVPTTCAYCGLQCGIHVQVAPELDRAVGVNPRHDLPGLEGLICRKGYACHEELRHPDRLRTPLVRRGGQRPGGHLEETSWDEALAFVATRLKAVRERYGADSVAVYGGGCLTNEKAYFIGKWARLALGTRHVDYNGRYCMSSAAAAHMRAFGIDRGLPFPLTDIALADFILLVGTNLAEAQPPLTQMLTQARRAGARIVAVDPRRTPTTRLADLHLRIRPGTDLALANGLLHIAVRDRYLDEPYIQRRTTGFDAARAAVQAYTPEYVAAITGLTAEEIETIAAWYGRAKRSLILSARGAEQHSKGVGTVLAFINLALACGQVGRRGAGYGTLTGQANGQGAREHGLRADQLPGYRSIEDPEHRRHVAAVWGCPEEAIPRTGLSAYELLDAAARGEIRAMVVLGSNPLVSAPHLGHVEQALSRLELLVVIDFFLSETAAVADAVLPGNAWAEEDGTVTNLEGRVLLRRKALPPPAGARPDLAILAELAERLGTGRYFRYRSAEDIFDELRQASRGGLADYWGITYARLEAEGGIFWPCPDVDHPGTPRLFEDRFYHADGRARFHAVTWRPAAEEPGIEYPYHLTTGRVAVHYQSGNQTRRLARLERHCPEPAAELHPSVADALGLAPGDRVRLRTRRGTIQVPVKLNPGMRPDTVFVPFHWGGALAVNRLVNPALDPMSRMPEFKTCAVAIEPASTCARSGLRRPLEAWEGQFTAWEGKGMSTLYERLGGSEGIQAVVNTFYDLVLADDRVKPFFARTNMDQLRRHQAMFLSHVTGGTAYTGRTIKKAHEGLGIRNEHFDAVVELLVRALESHGVQRPDIEAVVSALAHLRKDVVSGASPAGAVAYRPSQERAAGA